MIVHNCRINKSASFEPSSVKIGLRSDLNVIWLKREGYKKYQLYFTYLPRRSHGRISTKFCTAVEVVDIITCDKTFSDRLRDVDSVGDENGLSSLAKPIAVNTGLLNCASSDQFTSTAVIDDVNSFQIEHLRSLQ